ncbi:AAA family ATPase [Candidatus Electronema sp. TJ]|uniref:AAA family ATPase n=1 Tax=Candidatus Electronema sp. TJ TaxID=3401573 RepID=UPI003AA92DA6
MLEFIRVQGFKTLLDASFSLTSLNIFTGLNGMGKSTLMQVLLLLRQSYERNTLFDKGLLLKGEYAALGTGRDIFAEQADAVRFTFTWAQEKPLQFCFNYAPDSDMQPLASPMHENLRIADSKSLFNKNFQYLSADRIGPKPSYEVSSYYIHDLNSLGNHGEYTAHFIAENGNNPVSLPALRHDKAISLTILENIDRWMSEVSPGLRIRAAMQPATSSVSLGYAFDQGKETTANFKPQNVGFGITYVLPVLTALLRAKAGDMLIIENPESHLHPAGQSTVGKLCALAAHNGVQLFIETHSDHFLNGVRVAVKEKIIAPEEVKFFFLERSKDADSHESTVISPEIDACGRLNCWPAGFFDEWDRQLEKLL